MKLNTSYIFFDKSGPRLTARGIEKYGYIPQKELSKMVEQIAKIPFMRLSIKKVARQPYREPKIFHKKVKKQPEKKSFVDKNKSIEAMNRIIDNGVFNYIFFHKGEPYFTRRGKLYLGWLDEDDLWSVLTFANNYYR